MLTHRRAIRRTAVGTGVVTSLLALTAWPAAAAHREFQPQLWVGSTDLSHVAGEVQAEAQLGLNFGVGLTGSGDLTDTGDIRLTVDLAEVASVVVVTGLTAGCDAAPTLITCQIDPREANAEHQSMTLTAASNAEVGRTGTITVSAAFKADKEATVIEDVATIDVAVTTNRAKEPEATTEPTSPATASTPPPPVVIAPLPTVPPSTSGDQPSTEPGSPTPTSSTATDVVIFTPSLAEVPRALATRQPGFVQTGADGNRYVSYVGVAPAQSPGSPALTIALGASSAGLLALIIFGIVTARRANRPAVARSYPLDASRPYRGDPTLPEPADPYQTEPLAGDDYLARGDQRGASGEGERRDNLGGGDPRNNLGPGGRWRV